MPRDGANPYRLERLNAQVRQELALALAHDVKDPRLEMVTVVAVECARDLSEAKVRVSPLGTESQRAVSLRVLQSMEGFLRHLLGERLENLRRVPRLNFRLDDSIAHGVRVGAILRELEAREKRGGGNGR
ncbi:MAG TPA: 30S ribosome-binding factor RbfA [Candidatus Dormibacteraeota bacterium]|nr:30S ribosome-binding factor RbfA [Candidatus Dormibacteraeota bacterium]